MESNAPPPPVNQRALWITLLLPVTVVALLLLAAIISKDFNFTVASLFAGCAAIVGGWIAFGFVLGKRMAGLPLVMSILAYPVLQIVVCLTVFFFGCLQTFQYPTHTPPPGAPGTGDPEPTVPTSSPVETTEP